MTYNSYGRLLLRAAAFRKSFYQLNKLNVWGEALINNSNKVRFYTFSSDSDVTDVDDEERKMSCGNGGKLSFFFFFLQYFREVHRKLFYGSRDNASEGFVKKKKKIYLYS